jgi:cell division protease FtsH
MLPLFNNNKNLNKKDKLNSRFSIDRNLLVMSISAIVLIALLVYTIIKYDYEIDEASYYLCIGFLFVLLVFIFFLQKYKDKIRSLISKNKFRDEFCIEKEAINQEYSSFKEQDGKTYITPTTSTITFKDVAGIQEIKEELEEIVDFLNNPKKYQKYGVSLPRGVLLVGPPGVGKTLIAKAVAGEAEVPFFYQSGASFVHIYVGMGAKRVRELFTVAKLNSPSIIFIDEIDAVGKARGIGNNDERESTLNELLTQMDGFDSSIGVMVIAATNKMEVLDEALLRAGRFDRRVFLTLPTKKDRLEILKLYLKDKSINLDIGRLANETSGFSSSALSALVNEALLCMIKRDGIRLIEDDLEFAKKKIQFGKKQIIILTPEQKEILATYQAGKAFITKSKIKLLDNSISTEDLIYPSKAQLKDMIRKYLSGSVALEVIKNETYIVFEDELKEAYKIAYKMVDNYKMSLFVETLIQDIKDDLKTEIISNKDEILALRDILLKDEVVF